MRQERIAHILFEKRGIVSLQNNIFQKPTESFQNPGNPYLCNRNPLKQPENEVSLFVTPIFNYATPFGKRV